MSNVLSEVMLAAVKASYTVNGSVVSPLPAGYVLDTRFGLGHNGILTNIETGFQAIALRNATTGEYILAFTGTQDGQDWFQNLKLGWDQWDDSTTESGDPKQLVLTYISSLTDATKIHLTGHSLGGALAQYAAYDYIAQFRTPDNPMAPLPVPITLTTFNALGGVQGLTQYRPEGYLPSLFTGVYNRHYFVENDLVSRLGGAHLGGVTYMLKNLLGPNVLDPITAHGLEVIDLLTPAGFQDDLRYFPRPLDLPSLQPLAADLSRLFNSLGGNPAEASPMEAWSRIIAGVVGAATLYTSKINVVAAGEFDRLVNTILKGYASAYRGTAWGTMADTLSYTPWEAVLRKLPATLPVGGKVTGVALILSALSDAMEGFDLDPVVLLPQPLRTLVTTADFVTATTNLEGFIVDHVSSGWDTLKSLLGRIGEPTVTLSPLTVTEGGTGMLTLSLSRVSDVNGQAVILTLYDPDLIRLSGPGVYLRDAAAGEYLIIVPPGQMTHSITVTGLEDADAYADFSFIRAELTPFSELGSQFREAPYTIGEITIADNDPMPPTTLAGNDRANYLDSASTNARKVEAGAGRDMVWGSPQADEISGGAGGDWIAGFGGADHIDGGDGDDLISWLGGGSVVRAGEGSDIVNGNAREWFYISNPDARIGADVFWGDLSGHWQNYRTGLRLSGGWLDSGAGGGVSTNFNANGASLLGGGWTYQFSISAGTLNARYFHPTQAPNGMAPAGYWEHSIDYEPSHAETLIMLGEAGDDWLAGNGGDDYLDGGTGADLLLGNSGADVMDGGEDNDQMVAGEGDDLLLGGEGDDLMWGETGADVLYGGAGHDLMWGDDYSGQLSAQAGDDWLDGGDGNDQLSGQAGADVLFGGVGDDLLMGGANSDRLQGGEGDDVLHGDNHPDHPLAVELQGDDVLEGGAGDDSLWGSGGNDTLIGGAGADGLNGGAGDDLYLIEAGDGPRQGGNVAESVEDTSGTDTLAFGAGIAIEHIRSTRFGQDLYIQYTAVDSIFVFQGVTGSIERFSLNDGRTLDLRRLLAETGQDTVTLDSVLGGLDLMGGTQADQLRAVGGSSTFSGGRGNDNLIGAGGGNRYLYESGDGMDTIVNIRNDSIQAGQPVEAPDSLVFGAGIIPDDLTLSLGSLTIRVGGNSNDVIHLEGFDPNDVYRLQPIQRYEFADGQVLSHAELLARGFDIAGSAADDSLAGTNIQDRITGGAGNDNIQAGAGDDRVDGGMGKDILLGGAGNDTYVVDNSGDTVTEKANEGLDTVDSFVNWTLGANLENLTLVGTASINGTGNSLNNILTGNGANNTLSGGAGNDILNGMGGNDWLNGGQGADLIQGGDGVDTAAYGSSQQGVHIFLAVNMAVGGEAEGDTYSGVESLFGSKFDDTLIGDEGNNTLQGSQGNDFLNGYTGIDTASYYSDPFGATVDLTTGSATDGYGGSDMLYSIENLTGSNVGHDRLFGDAGNNTLAGQGGNDWLEGRAGNDRLEGGAGNDTLLGGAGNDTLLGGVGNDLYLFGRGDGADTWTDNDASVGNLDTARFGADVSHDQIWFRKLGSDLEARVIGTGDKALIKNWYAGSAYRIERFESGNGKLLLDSQVDALVSAMAGFTPPAAGQTTLPDSYRTALEPVLAANWQ